MTVRVLVVPADEAVDLDEREVPPDLETLRSLIGGGWLEGVGGLIDDTWHAYCDEEGKLKRLPVNVRATRMARLLGWPVGDTLCGDVIFLGNGPEGAEADVPDEVRGLAATMYGGTNVHDDEAQA